MWRLRQVLERASLRFLTHRQCSHRCWHELRLCSTCKWIAVSQGQLVHYSHQEHAEFFKLCGHFDFLILRCYPGHIEVGQYGAREEDATQADGGSQEEFEKSMNELRNGSEIT